MNSNPKGFAEGMLDDVSYLPEIFRIILRAWENAKTKIKESMREPNITSIWKDACCRVNRQRCSEVGPPFEFEFRSDAQYHFGIEDITADPDTGKPESRRDLAVYLYGNVKSCRSDRRGGEAYLIVECKIINKRSGFSQYVNEEGMCRFLERKYDPLTSYSAMASYIMDRNVADVRKEILKRIRDSQKLNTKSITESWNILSDFPEHSTTSHLLGDCQEIINIHHLFLEVKIAEDV